MAPIAIMGGMFMYAPESDQLIRFCGLLLCPDICVWQTPDMDDTSGQGWTLTEAAERLGVSREALRKRVVRGRIPAHKDENGVWLVDLPTPDNRADKSPDVAADRGGRTTPDTLSAPSPNLTAIMAQWITPLVERVEAQAVRIGHLENENQHLQTENERLTEALSDARRQRAPVVPSTTRDQAPGNESPMQPATVAPGGAQGESEASWRVRLRRWLGWG